MHDHALTTHNGSNALANAGDKVEAAMEAVRHGAAEVQERVTGVLPAVSHFMGRLVYTSAYGISYGVVFPVMLVVHMIPKENALVHGLVDGAIAARDQIEGWGTEASEEHLPAADEAQPGDGEAEHDSAKHSRRRSTRRSGGNKPKRSSRKS
jgi:hypothetical protein